MGWLILALLGGGSALVLLWSGIERRLWSMVGAGLMVGVIGYALQGHPTLAGDPVTANAVPIEIDPGMVELRGQMLGRFSGDAAFVTTADALMRSGDSGSAVRLLLSAIGAYPDSLVLWTGLGSALALHDGAVSPAARFAFARAGRLAPRHPAPPFFLGLAYVRAGDFAAARPYWAKALSLTPVGFSYRPAIAVRLALLERLLADRRSVVGEEQR